MRGRLRFVRLLAAMSLVLVCCGAARAEPGVSDGKIRLGQSAVFSGPAADFGNDYRAGLSLYFSRVNKAGGVNGRKIELVSLDDAYDPKRTAENTRRLLEEEQVFALIGYVATGNLAAAMPLAGKAGAPMFAPLVGTTSFRKQFDRHLFHVRASYELELKKILGHLATLGIRDIAVIYQDSAFGKSNLDNCLQLAGELKLQVREQVPMAINAADAKEPVGKLLQAKPGAVVMILAGRMVEVFLRDYRAAGGPAPLYTLSVGITDAKGTAQRLNGGLAGLVTASIVPPPSLARFPIVADYRSDLAEFGAAKDSYTVLEGYIAARVFVEGLKRAGRAPTRDGFISAMESLGRTRIADFPVEYGPGNHNGSTFVDLEMYGADGSLVR
jgi:ABC-type branched-subunit amino acid transport system substrate-binding protein